MLLLLCVCLISAVGKNDARGVRMGFFVHLAAQEVLVRRWDKSTESLVEIPADEAHRYAEGVRHFEFDANLGPYPLNTYQKWLSLTNLITKQVC